MPSVREGDAGPIVRQLQHALQAAGYYVGSEDGDFGRQTTAAVAYLQSCHGLTIDGIAGEQTFTALGIDVGTVSEISLTMPPVDIVTGTSYAVTVQADGTMWPNVRVVGWFRNAGGEDETVVAVDTPPGQPRDVVLDIPEAILAHDGECHVTVYVFDAEHGAQLEEGFASFRIERQPATA